MRVQEAVNPGIYACVPDCCDFSLEEFSWDEAETVEDAMLSTCDMDSTEAIGQECNPGTHGLPILDSPGASGTASGTPDAAPSTIRFERVSVETQGATLAGE